MLSGKVFVLVFLMIAVVGFVGIVSFITANNAPVDATINTSMNSYYDASQIVNQSMNKTIELGKAQVDFQSPLPLLIAICVMGSALFIFLVVARKKGGGSIYRIAVVGILVVSIVMAGCMGIQMPTMPQNMMKMDVPVQPNPQVVVQPAYSPTTNTSANISVNITIPTQPPTPPRFVYV